MDDGGLPILDCHQHFYDSRRLHYPVFAQRSAGFEAVVGDYRAMPRTYLPEDYARDTAGLNVGKTVWAEFIARDPAGEVRWAAELAREAGRPDGMITLVDFLDPGLGPVLDDYASVERIRCVREHLGWHPTNALLRYAKRPDLLSDPAWRRGIAALRGRGFVCEIEIFASQLQDLASLAEAYPDLQFTLSAMGWPHDLSSDGWTSWKRDLAAIAVHPNVAVKIFALECIFGIGWTEEQVRPWIRETIEIFGPGRCMFGSHLPICNLAGGVGRLYDAYFAAIDDFGVAEKRRMLHDTAAAIYRV